MEVEAVALWRTYFHLIWGTKDRAMLIDSVLEPRLYGYMAGKAESLGCIVHAIGGVSEHVHLVVSIPPKVSVAELVQVIKGSSSYYVNHELGTGQAAFAWQRGYGVLTLGSHNSSGPSVTCGGRRLTTSREP
jgi:putative transposase